MIDTEWLAGFAATCYPLNAEREAARVAFVTLDFKLPGTELEESWIPALRPAPG